MSEYVGSLPAFEVAADTMTEVVLDDGQKIETLVRSDVTVQRPNKLRSERRGPMAHLTLVYDGDQILLLGHRQNAYALTDAPNNLDAALDYARDRLEVEAPGADLLYTDSYEGLTRNAHSGRYLGQAEVEGVLCDHVAFRGEHADWQIWVERGERPVPRRYVITTTDQAARPAFVVELREWNVSPTIRAGTFAIAPPPHAERVEFARVFEQATEARAALQAGGMNEEGREG